MAKIDTTQFDGYETMTADEKLALLESFEFDDRSSEIERLKASVTKANSEAADWKKKHKQLLTEDEAAKAEKEEEFENIKQELEALRKEKILASYKSKFVESGYGKLAEQAAKALADGNTDEFFKIQSKFIEEHDKEIAVKNLEDTPRPPTGDGGKAWTAEEIMKISDPAERQAKIAENINLFES